MGSVLGGLMLTACSTPAPHAVDGSGGEPRGSAVVIAADQEAGRAPVPGGPPLAAADPGPGQTDPGSGQAGVRGSALIVAVDQASRQVLVLDGETAREAEPEADRLPVVWSWTADGDDRLADLEPARSWARPTEARDVVLDGEGSLLVTASGGLAALVDTATGTPIWATDLGTSANPHSAELLPDGNVAVVASTGGWVRLYAASEGPRSTTYTEQELDGAHAVQWDEGAELLWVLGDDTLLALRVGGTPDIPSLTPERSVPLPEVGGHDLAPVRSAPGTFWLSTGDRLWRYDSHLDRFEAVGLGAEDSARGIKSVGSEPVTGRLLTVTPDHAGPCSWCTSAVTFHHPDGTLALTGTELYKARWWTTPLPGLGPTNRPR
ncbi:MULTISPECIES: DUF6528 family protein [unclassified Kitasatospora]|uniref:DUF6528 family protein n=1 Tax=unclassified Kitasatospora TaxID=2633591 RepID=UPI003801A850